MPTFKHKDSKYAQNRLELLSSMKRECVGISIVIVQVCVPKLSFMRFRCFFTPVYARRLSNTDQPLNALLDRWNMIWTTDKGYSWQPLSSPSSESESLLRFSSPLPRVPPKPSTKYDLERTDESRQPGQIFAQSQSSAFESPGILKDYNRASWKSKWLFFVGIHRC